MNINIEELQDSLIKLAQIIESDTNLDEATKKSILDVIEQVSMDPQSGNIKALTILIDKLSDANKYLASITNLTHLQSEELIANQSVSQ